MATRAHHLGSKPFRPLNKRSWRVLLSALLVILAVFLVGIFYWTTFLNSNSLTQEQALHSIGWRMKAYTLKASGKAPGLTWADLCFMTRQRAGFGLESFADGSSLDGSVINLFDGDEDVEAGAALFNKKCSVCHGGEATGWVAPALNHPGLKHGDSDLAIYKVLRDGVAGTPMVTPNLSRLQRWQVVSYVHSLMFHHHGGEDAKLPKVQVSQTDLLSSGSRTDQWLTYSGSYDGHRYSSLKQIDTANVSHLRLHWIQQFNTSDSTIEATPIVVNGVIFTTEPPSNVVALDARSGGVIWRYERTVASELSLCCGRLNRGVAIYDHMLFLDTLDGYLVALDANTGKMMWETRVADPSDGYSLTGVPLIAGHSVITGVAGGDFGTRGFLSAYDPDTGELQWKFDTVPGPGEFGHDTWQNDAWKSGGGATWATGSYDPGLGLVYWGVGNPGPDYNGDLRPGDNLFTNSVVALHASTGKLAWHFQFTPHDEHDWDSTQTPILADIPINGSVRKVICWANRNGFYYVLDRTTGEFITGVPFVEQNWAKALDAKGRPILSDTGRVTNEGNLTRPAFSGATNWQNPALDAAKGLFFVHATEGAAIFTKSLDHSSPDKKERKPFWDSSAYSPDPPTVVVRALDVSTGLKKWEYFSPHSDERAAYSASYSGLLATGGGLVFGASGGSAFALDSSTGHELWRVSLGGDTRAAPITFTIDGTQVIAISAGRSLFVFGL